VRQRAGINRNYRYQKGQKYYPRGTYLLRKSRGLSAKNQPGYWQLAPANAYPTAPRLRNQNIAERFRGEFSG